MIMPKPIYLALIALLLMSLCGPAAALTAGNVSSIRTTRWPPVVIEGQTVGLVVIAGRPVIIHSAGASILKEDRSGWIAADLRDNLLIRGVISEGQQAFVLLGDGGRKAGINRLARLELDGSALRLHPLAPLPVILTSAVGTTHGATVLVAGVGPDGVSRLLELSTSAESEIWTAHAAWTGGGEPTSLVMQNSAVYLTVSGREHETDRMLRWSKDAGWRAGAELPGRVVTGSGRAIGQAHVLYLVDDASGAASLMSYHTISDAWAKLPYRRADDIIGAVAWEEGVLLAYQSGDVLSLESVALSSDHRHLNRLDWIIVSGYLLVMLGMGIYFHVRSKRSSTADFFVGSRAIPFWAAGVSLYAANVSSISYLAVPAKAFETDWQYMTGKFVTVLGLVFVATWVVPALRRLDLVSAFDYLERRFNPAIRLLASATCIAMNVGGRMSVVLYLPALAIATITGVDVKWTILMMGICTIVYTTLGGMRAVVWTDVIQVLVLMSGALFAIGFVIHSLGGAAIYRTAIAYDKTRMLNFSLDLTQPTVWGFLLLMLCDTVLTFPKDQVLMQRTLATSSDRNAGRSVWIFAAVLLPAGFIFYLIGTVLFAFYKTHPERLDPMLPIDATFPSFIATELPAGVTGLIIVGLFAAAMGSLSGIINSVATLLSVDFYEKLVQQPVQRKSVRFAEWMSVVIGLAGIGLAMLLSLHDIHSLLDLTIELAGLLGGGFAGAYTLGMFTRRANSAGVAIGMVTAIVVTLLAWSMKLVHPYFYLVISILVSIVVGYLASLLFAPPRHSLEGLTVRFGGHRMPVSPKVRAQ